MTEEEKNRLHRICYDSKQGRTCSLEESHFIQEMYRKYPKEYKAIHKEAAEEATRDFKAGFGGK